MQSSPSQLACRVVLQMERHEGAVSAGAAQLHAGWVVSVQLAASKRLACVTEGPNIVILIIDVRSVTSGHIKPRMDSPMMSCEVELPANVGRQKGLLSTQFRCRKAKLLGTTKNEKCYMHRVRGALLPKLELHVTGIIALTSRFLIDVRHRMVYIPRNQVLVLSDILRYYAKLGL